MKSENSRAMGSTGIRFTEEQLRRCDEKSAELGISRNEFIRDAVEFYLEWLSRESTEKFLTPALESVFSAKLRDTEDRIARILFKMAVDQNMLAQVLIYQGKYTKDSVEEVRRRAVNMVRETNGTINATDLLIDEDDLWQD